MNFKGNMSIFELLEQPFNVVHEMYRLVFLKNKLQKEKEEKEKLEAEEKKKQQIEAHNEQLRNNIPAFATKSHVLGNKQTPPQSKEEKSSADNARKENSSTSTPLSESVVNQMISKDMEDALEEVLS